MAGPTVTVGCKLPHGLHLDIGETRVTLNGVNSTGIIGGHGITENVDKEFFDKWMEMYKKSEMVKNGLIFANEKTASVKAEAIEKKDNPSGFEGINPAKPGNGVEPVTDDKK